MSVLEQWLEEVQANGVKLGLERVRRALELLGSPQKSYPSLLVGGTNGKGSVVTLASALLNAAGHRVGSTLSPHLLEYRERFRIDGRIVEADRLEALAAKLHSELHGQAGLGELTFFELGACLALSLFADEGVAASVVEVGMGGELDATRASEPCVAALVTIDLDHQRYLGETVQEIARTKARIAPRDGVLVCTELRPDRLEVVREEAARVDCALRLPGTHFEWDFRGGALSFESQRLRLDSVTLRMQGAHQGLNAACAVAAVEALCEQAELKMPDPWNVASALGQARLTGRLERVRSPGGPAFLLDGAHNPAGARALGAALSERRRPRQRVWLLASMQDKARAEMLAELLPHVDRVLCTRGTSSPRFESPEQLVSELEEAGAQAGVASSVQAAVGALTRELGPRDEVLVAGSLYLVGDVRHALGLPVS